MAVVAGTPLMTGAELLPRQRHERASAVVCKVFAASITSSNAAKVLIVGMASREPEYVMRLFKCNRPLLW